MLLGKSQVTATATGTSTVLVLSRLQFWRISFWVISQILSYAHPNVSKYRILHVIQFQKFLVNLIVHKPES